MRFEFVTNEIAAGFAEWLKGICAGEGARKSFFYFKKGCTIAVEEGTMKKNPCNGIVIRSDANVLTKSILSPEEIERLLCTYYKQERPDIQRAFVFSLYLATVLRCKEHHLCLYRLCHQDSAFQPNQERGKKCAQPCGNVVKQRFNGLDWISPRP